MQATYERSDWIQDTGIPYSGSNPHSYNPYQQRDNKKDIVPLETEIPGAGLDLAVAEKCEFRKAKFKVAAFAILTCLVLVLNIIVLGIYGSKGNVGQPITIFSGTCPQSRSLGFWVHFLINVLSTLVLVGSLTSVQVLHLLRNNVTFGPIPSLDLRFRFVWIFIGFTTLPFHLLYNSAVFETAASNPFYWAVVGEDFFSSGPTTAPQHSDPEFVPVYHSMRTEGSSWTKLNNLECIKTYGSDFHIYNRNVILVTSNSSSPASLYQAYYQPLSAGGNKTYSWMCPLGSHDTLPLSVNDTGFTAATIAPANCTLASLESGAANWTISGFVPGTDLNATETPQFYTGPLPDTPQNYYPVEYCLSEPVASQCWINLNWSFLLTVTVFNAVKAVWMLVSWSALRRSDRLWSVGDQLARLIKKPNMWIGAPSRILWAGTLLVSFATAGAAGACLALALSSTRSYGYGISFRSLWEAGFGSVSLDSEISLGLTIGTSTIPGLSLLTNLPQVFIAILFYFYANLITTMVSYSHYSKLSISSPSAKAMAEPAIHLPLHYVVLISCVSAITHWMASLAFFLTSIKILDYGPAGELTGPELFIAGGFSPIAIAFAMIVGGSAFVILVALGFRRYRWE